MLNPLVISLESLLNKSWILAAPLDVTLLIRIIAIKLGPTQVLVTNGYLPDTIFQSILL